MKNLSVFISVSLCITSGLLPKYKSSGLTVYVQTSGVSSDLPLRHLTTLSERSF